MAIQAFKIESGADIRLRAVKLENGYFLGTATAEDMAFGERIVASAESATAVRACGHALLELAEALLIDRPDLEAKK